MDDWTKRILNHRYTTTTPHVRAACEAVAKCYDLTWHDRDDLEQELWLALLTQWQDRDCRLRTDSVDHIRPLARRLGLLLATAFDVADADVHQNIGDPIKEPPSRLNTVDLRLDIADLIARLPVEVQRCCHRLMADVDSDSHPLFAGVLSIDPARLAGLRAAFETHGLRDYL